MTDLNRIIVDIIEGDRWGKKIHFELNSEVPCVAGSRQPIEQCINDHLRRARPYATDAAPIEVELLTTQDETPFLRITYLDGRDEDIETVFRADWGPSKVLPYTRNDVRGTGMPARTIVELSFTSGK